MKKLIVATVLLFISTIPITVAAAQGCALCYTQAHGSGARMIRSLDEGILILMFPPIGICLMIMVMAYRKRNRFVRPQPQEKHEGPHADLGW